ncbi:MAG TPA: DNA polymerase III subunit epsilon, partial [Rhodocyclaceae bacterium]|nr:DNA polymerase III subunit epsilon [Rhodocyclaceae bacterium]
MSPKARQAWPILAACGMVAAILISAAVALWRDLGVDEQAVLEPILNPRLGLLIMIGLAGCGAVAVAMKSFVQAHVAAPALLADEIGLIVGTDPARRLKAQADPDLNSIADAVNALADQRRSLQDDVEARIREARLSVEEERNRLAALMSELTQSVVVCNLDGRVLLYNNRA